MINRILIFSMLLCGCHMLTPRTNNTPRADETPFDWLVGKWQDKTDSTLFVETWTWVDPKTLEGHGSYIAGGDTLFSEQLLLRRIGKYWTYIASPQGNEPVLFTLTYSDENTFIFQNREHDFPQKIGYEKKGKDQFMAWIEGVIDSSLVREEYNMRKP